MDNVHVLNWSNPKVVELLHSWRWGHLYKSLKWRIYMCNFISSSERVWCICLCIYFHTHLLCIAGHISQVESYYKHFSNDEVYFLCGDNMLVKTCFENAPYLVQLGYVVKSEWDDNKCYFIFLYEVHAIFKMVPIEHCILEVCMAKVSHRSWHFCCKILSTIWTQIWHSNCDHKLMHRKMV